MLTALCRLLLHHDNSEGMLNKVIRLGYTECNQFMRGCFKIAKLKRDESHAPPFEEIHHECANKHFFTASPQCAVH